MIKFWELRGKLSDKTSIHSYLYRAVKNNCIDLIKHKSIKQKYIKKSAGNFILKEEYILKDLINEEYSKKLKKEINNLKILLSLNIVFC